MTKTTHEPRKDTRLADFPKTTVEMHNHLAALATTQASLSAMPHREGWLQLAHNHKLAAAEAEAEAEAEARRVTTKDAEELAKLLSPYFKGIASELVRRLAVERDALLEENTRLKKEMDAVDYAASPFGRKT